MKNQATESSIQGYTGLMTATSDDTTIINPLSLCFTLQTTKPGRTTSSKMRVVIRYS